MAALRQEEGAEGSLEYLLRLFDSYAAHFDASLHQLQYSAHQLVADMLKRYLAAILGALRQQNLRIMAWGWPVHRYAKHSEALPGS